MAQELNKGPFQHAKDHENECTGQKWLGIYTRHEDPFTTKTFVLNQTGFEYLFNPLGRDMPTTRQGTIWQ